MQTICRFCLFIQLFSLTGCALLINGTRQKITINSSPQGVRVSIGEHVIGATPFSYKLNPRWQRVLTFTLPDSSQTRTTCLETKYQIGWIIADAPISTFGINIPMGIDLLSGAAFRFKQDTVLMDFSKTYIPYVSYRDSTDAVKDKKRDSLKAINSERRSIARTINDSIRYMKIELQRLEDSIALFEHILKRDITDSQIKHITGLLPNIVSLQWTALFIKNIELSYERRVAPDAYIGIAAGYKPRVANQPYSNHNIFDIDGPTRENMLMPFSESYYLGINVKQFVWHSFFYWGVEFFGRFTNYDQAVVNWEGLSNYGRGQTKITSDSLKANIVSYGFKIVPGVRKIINLNPNLGLVFDIYCGFSLRVRHEDLFHYKISVKNVQSYPPNPKPEFNRSEYNTNYDIAPQLGAKIGLIF